MNPSPQTQINGWKLANTYSALPSQAYSHVSPTAVANPELVVINYTLATELGLDLTSASRESLAEVFSGNQTPPAATPLAQAYAGHQFGSFVNLGDGRAILLGEQVTPDGSLRDIQLKGSGITPYSRRGDGRAALGPMLREYLISEAMRGLGIPSTGSLAVVSTGEPVLREKPLQGAILTRTAASHIRVGTFEYFAARNDIVGLKALAEYSISRHYPELEDGEDTYLGFLHAVIDRQAALIAQWLLCGFVHGVMNTDNMAISGETIDYGPCAFIDAYDPRAVFSSIDRQGRYAFGNQPHIAQWNLARFAETLIPLISENEQEALERARQAIEGFPRRFTKYWLQGMRNKLGLSTAEADDAELFQSLLSWMEETEADYTATFRTLSMIRERSEFPDADERLLTWIEKWLARQQREEVSIEQRQRIMLAHNPLLIPRNQFVQEALDAATEQGDLAPFNRLCEALQQPFTEQAEYKDLYRTPQSSNDNYRTFCGT